MKSSSTANNQNPGCSENKAIKKTRPECSGPQRSDRRRRDPRLLSARASFYELLTANVTSSPKGRDPLGGPAGCPESLPTPTSPAPAVLPCHHSRSHPTVPQGRTRTHSSMHTRPSAARVQRNRTRPPCPRAGDTGGVRDAGTRGT